MWLWPRLPFRPPKKDTGEEYPNSESQDLQFKEHFRLAGAWDGENSRVIKCTKHGVLTVVSPHILKIFVIQAPSNNYDLTLPYLRCSQVWVRSIPPNTGLCYVWKTPWNAAEGSLPLWPGEWVKLSVDDLLELSITIGTSGDTVNIIVEGL